MVYTLGGRAIIEDRGSKLLMLQTDRFAVESALRLAEAKFGSVMIVSGPREFRERAALVAAEAGIRVTFQDKSLEKIREKRTAEIVSERTQQAHYRKLGREYQTPDKPDATQPEPNRLGTSQERAASKNDRDKGPDRER